MKKRKLSQVGKYEAYACELSSQALKAYIMRLEMDILQSGCTATEDFKLEKEAIEYVAGELQQKADRLRQRG